MRKGRHRRHMEARALKQSGPSALLDRERTRHTHSTTRIESEVCAECQRTPHASWCRADMADED